MKNLMMCLLFVVSLMVAGCGSNSTEKRIVGNWVPADGGKYPYFKVYKQGNTLLMERHGVPLGSNPSERVEKIVLHPDNDIFYFNAPGYGRVDIFYDKDKDIFTISGDEDYRRMTTADAGEE